jgi:hypothetical protein
MAQNIDLLDNLPPTMMTNIKDAFLCSYSIASAEMRYNELCSRDVYLRVDPKRGPILRGELSGCDRGGFVDLSQIFLEFGMSCEGCKNIDVAEKSVMRFGQNLGSIFVPSLQIVDKDLPHLQYLTFAIRCILNSMNVRYSINRITDCLLFKLSHCPLNESAHASGLGRELNVARLGITVFFEKIVQIIEPGWQLIYPSLRDTDRDLITISVKQK